MAKAPPTAGGPFTLPTVRGWKVSCDGFAAELDRVGLRRVRPRFYLSTEWGVPEGTVAIAIPFYLARAELTALHARRAGHVEGNGPALECLDNAAPSHEIGLTESTSMTEDKREERKENAPGDSTRSTRKTR